MKLIPIFLAILLVGCGQANYKFTPVSKEIISDVMIKTNHINALLYTEITRSDFAATTTEWINKVFSPNLTKVLFANNELTYADGYNDCVKFSTHALSEAYTLYYDESNKIKDTSLAVGEYMYIPGVEGHEILFFIVNDGDGFKLVFYEPQSQQIVDLDKEDRSPCIAWTL